MASVNLEYDWVNTKNVKLNEIVVQGGQLLDKSIKHFESMI